MGFVWQRFLVTALLMFLTIIPRVVPEVHEEDPDLPYLYDVDAGVVIEYMPSASTKNPLRPDFLYSTNNGPRIVEFYAVRLMSPRVQSLSVAMVLLLYKLEYSIEVILLVTSVDACCLLLGLVDRIGMIDGRRSSYVSWWYVTHPVFPRCQSLGVQFANILKIIS